MNQEEVVLCELCNQPMPKGEEMFNYHGFSGPCPKSVAAQAPYCNECETFHPEGVHGQWIDRKDPRHSQYPNGEEDEFVPNK